MCTVTEGFHTYLGTGTVVQHKSARGKRRNSASAENDTARRGKKQKESRSSKIVSLSARLSVWGC